MRSRSFPFCCRQQLTLYPAHQLLVRQLLLLVVYHWELVCLQLVFLQLCRLTHQICQLNHLPAFRIVLYRLPAHLTQLIHRLVVNLREEFFRTQRLVTYLFDSLQILRQISLQFPKICLYFLDKLVEKHLHDSKIIFELLHNFISDVIVDKKFVLLLSESFTVDLSLL